MIPKVAVLMSTYCGEKYLEEQILSILNQKNVDLDLYIRDDGSKDSTLEILEKFQKKYSNITVSKGNNIGVGPSFMSLVYTVNDNYSYYCFADQDDVWKEDKIISAIRFIKEYDDKPILYASNQLIVDESLDPIGLRFKSGPAINYKRIISGNQFSGCTMVWNRPFLLLVRSAKNTVPISFFELRIHDVWFAAVAATCAKLVFDDVPYIYYRQHSNNVVGLKANSLSKIVYSWINKIRSPKMRNGRSLLCKYLVLSYYSLLNSNNYLSTLSYAANYKCSKDDAVKLFLDTGFKSKNESVFSYYLKIVLGLF